MTFLPTMVSLNCSTLTRFSLFPDLLFNSRPDGVRIALHDFSGVLNCTTTIDDVSRPPFVTVIFRCESLVFDSVSHVNEG